MRYSPLILVLLVVTSLFPLVQAQGTFWLSGWDYRIPFTLTANVDDVQANFTLTIPSTYHASVRVTEDDGVTLIPVWNDSATNIWARFPYANQTYYLYYGNEDAAAVYDATAVFQRVISSGVALALPLNEGVGNPVDYANGLTVTNTGADWTAGGKYGNYLTYVAANSDRTTIGDNNAIDMNLATTNYSIMFYYKTTDSNSRDFVAKSGGGKWYFIRNLADGTVQTQTYDGGNQFRSATFGDYNDGTLRNVITTYDAAANAATIYINGVSDTSVQANQDCGDTSNAGALTIGQGLLSGGYWSGSIETFFMFNYKLSAGEISDLGASQYYPQCSSGNLGNLYLRRWSDTLTTAFGNVESSFSVEANNNLLAIGLLAVGAAFTFTIVLVKRRTN